MERLEINRERGTRFSVTFPETPCREGSIMSARLPINLMLVEDERIVAFDLKRQLQGFGYHVSSVVASGEQAVTVPPKNRIWY
jgi:hypothetical protein